MADEPMSIGEYLKRSRLARRLQLEDISQELHIRTQYLVALEEDKWDKLPGEVYAIGFLRSYARFLGVDADALVDYRRRLTQQESSAGEERHVPAAPVLSRRARKSRAKVARVPTRSSRPARDPEPGPTGSGRVVLGAAFVLVALFVVGMFMLHNQTPTASAPVARTHASHSPSSKPPRPSHHPVAKSPAKSPAAVIKLTSNNAPAGTMSFSVSGGPLNVNLAFTGPCWVEVWKNGVTSNPSGFTYAAGQTLTVTASSSVEIWAGTRAFSLTVDHEVVSLPDPLDRVVHVTFVQS